MSKSDQSKTSQAKHNMIGNLISEMEECHDDGVGLNEILYDWLATLSQKNLDSLQKMLKPHLPECDIETTIGVQIAMKCRLNDLDHDEVAAAIAKEFNNSPLSAEEWFSEHLVEFYE